MTVKCDCAIFDQNDESTLKFNEQTTIVQVFMDDIFVSNLKPAYSSPYFGNMDQTCTFVFPDAFANNPKSVVRLIAKDITQCPNNKAGTGINDDIDARVGTISFNKEYFTDVHKESFGQTYKQKITLFDEVDDDDFDGELNEDDEEMPMISCEFTINDKQPAKEESTPSPQKMVAAIEQPDDLQGPSQPYVNPKRVVKNKTVPL